MTSRPVLGRAAALIGLLAIGLSAQGCVALGKALGVGKSPPDEFAIVTKAPLVVPPDFALRPPRPGEARPQEISPSRQASVALFGDDANIVAEGDPSLSEQILMRDAGVLSADPNIRTLLDVEAGGLVDKRSGFANMVMFWRTNGDEIDDSEAPLVVDNPEQWYANRRDSIERATGKDAEVKIRRNTILNLPGVL